MKLISVLLACGAGISLAACSGGSSSPPAMSVPGTTSPGTAPTNPSVAPPSFGATGPLVQSTVTALSYPSGLAVSITRQGTATQTMTTPTTTTPGFSNGVTTYTITPSNGAVPFAFAADQRGAGSTTVVYDQAADTNGTLSTVSASSVAETPLARRPAPDAAEAGTVRRAPETSRAPRAALAPTGRLVVRYAAAALAARGRSAEAIERDAGAAGGRTVGFVRDGLVTRLVPVPAGASADAFARALAAATGVVSVAPEARYRLESTNAVSPNDPHFAADQDQQWGLYEIGAPNAWGYTKGSPSVQIAMIDTGVDFAQPDLASKVTYAESVVNGATTAGTAAAQDTDGHGTNVAGIAAAATNNGTGFAGAGFNAGLQIYKVFANAVASNAYAATSAQSGDVTQAIYDAVSHGARVINLSLGGCQAESVDTMERDAVEYAISKNVVVVAASGNERSGTSGDPNCSGGSSTVDFPGAFDGVVSVGATSLDDSAQPGVRSAAREFVASYSNAGPGLTIVAPGGDPSPADTSSSGTVDLLHWIDGLYTTTPADPSKHCSTTSDCRALFAGTSQATPHVAGTVALMLSLNAGLSPAQVTTILETSADDIGDANEGHGRLDAYRALAAVAGDANPPALPVKRNFVAFAYAPNGTNVPSIVDVTYPAGVPVSTSGGFRIADVQPNQTYKIGVWYDANGDGKVDAGDFFGTSGTCSSSAPCTSAASLAATRVQSGFVLN